MPLPTANYPSSYYTTPQELSTFKDGSAASPNQISTATLTSTYASSGAITITATGSFTTWQSFGIARNGTTGEEIFYYSKDNDNLYVLSDGRAQNGTSASAGSIGHVMTFVEVRVTASILNQVLSEVKALGLNLYVGATPTFTGVTLGASGVTTNGTVRYNNPNLEVRLGGAWVILNATTTPTADRVPLANGSGKIANGWLNTGSGNGLDADTVDSYHAADFAILSGSSPSLKVQVKSADQALTVGSFANVSDLTFVIPNSAVYYFKYMIFFDAVVTNVNTRLNFTGTYTSFRAGTQISTNEVINQFAPYGSSPNNVYVDLTPGVAVTPASYIVMEGIITVSSSGTGTLSFQAEGSTSTNAKQGSMLFLIKQN